MQEMGKTGVQEILSSDLERIRGRPLEEEVRPEDPRPESDDMLPFSYKLEEK